MRKDNQFYTTEDARLILGVTTSRIRQLARAGTLKAVKFGRDWQIERASVEQYAAAHPRRVPGAKGEQ
jgi:excisionase family DNA binding protein